MSRNAQSISQSSTNVLWAKDTGETLLEHSCNVVEVARLVCDSLPFSKGEREHLFKIVAQLAALHDAGKAAKGFQEMLRKIVSRWPRRHEILSVGIATQISVAFEAEELLAIITHHKSIPEGSFNDGEKCLPDEQLPFLEPNVFQDMVEELKPNEALLREFLDALSYKLGADWQTEHLDLNSMNLGKLKRAWLLRSSGIGQRDRIEAKQRRYASLLRGLLVTSDHMASAHQTPTKLPPLLEFDTETRQYELRGNAGLPFQEKCGNLLGDSILKAPTGSGKTAAVLLWAAKNQTENGRLFYVLPHTASINAMHRRLQKIYSTDAVGVLHHKNAAYLFRLFEQDCCTSDAARMARTVSGLARELYHPIRVTTPHQTLRVALHGKGWELGLAEFPNACFIFDEIHVFEPLLMGLTIATSKWLKSLGAKLFFASATIPKFMERILREELGIPEKNVLSPNPELDGDKEVCNKIRHRIEVRSGSLIEGLQTIIEEIEDSNQSALIVCNHVATSQQVFQLMKGRFGNEVMLLHSRFNSRDRTRIETAITGSNPPRVLVATQAVEVSLDLDYERGYTEPAPADALGQRLGRVNRKGKRTPAPIVVFEEPSNGYLYDEELTRRTIELLRQVDELTEQQLTEIVDEVYGDGYSGKALDEYKRGLQNTTICNFDEEIIAGTHRAWVEDIIEASDGQVEVLPVEGTDENGEPIQILDEFKQYIKEKNYLRAKELLVPIRIGQKFIAQQRGVLRFDKNLREFITTLQYSAESGLDLTMQSSNIL